MSALDLFSAVEGAHTPQRDDLTAAPSPASPDVVGESPAAREFPVTRTDLAGVLALGFVIGVGTCLVVFIGSQVVIGWFS